MNNKIRSMGSSVYHLTHNSNEIYLMILYLTDIVLILILYYDLYFGFRFICSDYDKLHMKHASEKIRYI